MPKQRQGMRLELTPKLTIQLNCSDAMTCGECYPENLPDGNIEFRCPLFKLTVKPLIKKNFIQKHPEPDDIYFS